MIRGAIVGFGAVAANGHCPAYTASSAVEIVAVVDPSPARRDAALEALPSVTAFATMADLAAGPAIDFVDICTPPAWHGEGIFAALAQGWNVLCEKPLILDLVEFEKIRTLSLKAERAVVPVHNWKYAPIIRAATEALRGGAIGQLQEVRIETLRVEDCAAADPNHPNWRRDPALAGGGILMDHGWHAIYLARHWFGEDPIKVEATLHRAPIGVEDEATMTLHFASGRATIFLTWRASERRNTMRLSGDRGTIEINDGILKTGGDKIPFESALSAGSHHPDWFAAMLPDVIASFNSPDKRRAELEEAGLCLSVIRGAYEVASRA